MFPAVAIAGIEEDEGVQLSLEDPLFLLSGGSVKIREFRMAQRCWEATACSNIGIPSTCPSDYKFTMIFMVLLWYTCSPARRAGRIGTELGANIRATPIHLHWV